MNSEEWERKYQKLKIAQKCPRCNKITLKFVEGRLLCENCGFEQR